MVWNIRMRQDKEKIRVAFIIPNLKRGGAEKVLIHLVNNIDYNKFQPIIFCLKAEGELLPLINKEVGIVNLESPRVYFIYKALRTPIKTYKPHILIGWMGHINAMLAFYKPWFPKKLIVCCRESSIPSRFINHYKFPGLFRNLYKKMRRLDGIICQSQAMKEDLEINFQIPGEQITVIPNPVAESKPTVHPLTLSPFITDKTKVVLFVGRFSKEKRPLLAIELMSKMPENYKMIMVGYGPMTGQVKEYLRTTNTAKRVMLVTDCSDPSFYYQQADCLLMTSAFEGFPNVLLEANAYGCPVVVCGTKGGAREVVEEHNGIYVDQKSEDNLSLVAAAIEKICNETTAQRKERIIKANNEKYGMSVIINKYEKYLVDLLKNKPQ